ncbi:lipoprotein; possible cell wall-associated hydrolase [Pedobacter sp. BAL39]|uniref:C40 family peptidase n=1 Tax=Pedobacter sp. BAL39 TaxID=391596 RepID=UPI0001559C7A|nr:C40 family peptidase [Pedobacter sp. BAL39]EDM38683.1 lipoprotein; possible cell wall-associated hydrolase [Pedobacter sp. BAL39]
MEDNYAICRLAVAPLRVSASDRAEIVSQLLFGEHVMVIGRDAQWRQVRNVYDGYEGWVDFKQLAPLSQAQFEEIAETSYLVPAELANILMDDAGSKYFLSPGSSLPLYKDGVCYLGDTKYRVMFHPKEMLTSPDKLVDTALFFQNVPYLWGGKTLFGIDCSGFTQVVFRLHGIALLRDAWQQSEQGTAVDFLPEVKAGDVAFFDNAEGRIIHVGIMLSDSEIIHASGKVRIDRMDQEGIYNDELGRYTHKLRIIKRFF